MAEYCKKCAEASNGKYFFDGYPVFCEICGKEYNGNKWNRFWILYGEFWYNFWQKFKKN